MGQTAVVERTSGQGRGFGSPGKYIQRAGELDRLGEHVLGYGSRALVLVDPFILSKFGARITESLTNHDLEFETLQFGGECSAPEIERITAAARKFQAHVVVGIGGGKTMDTAKCAAVDIGAYMVIVPTTASTDAPCSAIAVRYTPEGQLDTGLFLGRNPDLVLVDSAVVAAAPIRYLVAGMGDALSTWPEARANYEARLDNFVGARYPASAAGLGIAKLCHQVLLRDGMAARLAAEQGLLTPAVENIVEANTLLSGVGFENCGVSAAHGISDAFAVLDPDHKLLHGEKVGFGVLCLLVLEGRDSAEFYETWRFMRDVGLPTRLDDLFGPGVGPKEARLIASAALGDGASTWRISGPLTVDGVTAAILAADRQSDALHKLERT